MADTDQPAEQPASPAAAPGGTPPAAAGGDGGAGNPIAAFRADPENQAILSNPGHPKHQEKHAELYKLYEAAHDGGLDADVNSGMAKLTAAGAEVLETPDQVTEVLGNPRWPEDTTTEEMREGIAEVSGWCAEMKVTRAEMTTLAQAYDDFAKAPEKFGLDDLEARQASCMKALGAVWGDAAAAKVETARRVVARMDRDGRMTEFLENSRMGDNPAVIRVLAEIGARNGW